MTVQRSRLRYVPARGTWDEAFDAEGGVRPPYAPLMAALEAIDLAGLRRDVAAYVAADGATFGGDGSFPVDPIPRLIDTEEWAVLEAGLGQRLRALEAFATDMAGREPRIVGAGVLPEELATTLPFGEPDLADLPPPPGPRIAIAGLDVVRGADGRFRVLEDNVRTPSGMAYLLAARRAVVAHLPDNRPRRPIRAELAHRLGTVLAAARPRPESDDAVVLLSDGPSNSAHFEHRVLADLAGVPLVEPGDLRRDGGRLRLRDGGRPVQVVYRRTDEDRVRGDDGALTPMGELLLEPQRAGTLVVVNAFGSGVADDKRVYAHVEAMIRFYLGEEPLLGAVRTYELEEPAQRDEVLERVDELALKPRDGYGGKGVVVGPAAGDEEVRRAARELCADPAGWVAQEPVRLSTHPTVVRGRLEPRHVDLRPFVFSDGERTAVLPGGLTRVALEEGSAIVNSSRGGGGKDTWVLP